ncbi:MAG: fatty acid CoA ligase family protein [Vicinamibacteria bacterium]
MNVARFLSEQAVRGPERPAIVAPDGRGRFASLSFAELDRRSDRIAAGLRAHGLEPGTLTLVMVRAGAPLIGLTWALFKHGAVPVLIDPGMGRKAFLRAVADTRPQAFIGIPLAHLARRLFPAAFRGIRRAFVAGPAFPGCGPSLAAVEAAGAAAGRETFAARSEDLAAVLFTSGSTGPAKGALYTHGNFEAQVELLQRAYSFERGERDLAAFPLFSLFDAAFGMTSVIPELEPSRPGRCDPAKVVAALQSQRCTTAFGSPAIWRRVAPWCLARGIRLPELRRVLIAGASVPPDLVASLHRVIAEDGEVHTPYGATEALPVASIAGREVVGETAALTRKGHGTCVGRPVSGADVRVIEIRDDPIAAWSEALALPPGEVGEICVRGPVVTRDYLNRAEATAAAKIPDGDAVWHRMGDLGRFDGRGRLWFAGRKAERVRGASGPLFTDLVEGLFASDPRVARCALVGVGPAGSERPVLVVEGRADAALAAEIRARGVVHEVLFHPRFPVDVRHNAKIHRLTLKAWAEERLPS